MQKYIEYLLLAAILAVLSYGVIAGGEKRVGAVDYSSTSNFPSDVTIVGDLTQGGSVTSLSTTSATYTISASDLCGSSYIKFTPLSAATTVTLPATSTLLTTCLPSIGMFKDLNYESTATSTVIAAGAGEVLGYSASTTIAAGKHATLRLIRDGINTVDVLLTNITN